MTLEGGERGTGREEKSGRGREKEGERKGKREGGRVGRRERKKKVFKTKASICI